MHQHYHEGKHYSNTSVIHIPNRKTAPILVTDCYSYSKQLTIVSNSGLDKETLTLKRVGLSVDIVLVDSGFLFISIKIHWVTSCIEWCKHNEIKQVTTVSLILSQLSRLAAKEITSWSQVKGQVQVNKW